MGNPNHLASKMSDEEIVALERNRAKEAFWAGLAMALIVVAILNGVDFAFRAGALKALGISDGTEDLFHYGVFAGLLVITIPFLIRRYRLPKAAMSEHILLKQIEWHHRRWRWIFLVLALGLFLLAFSVTPHPHHMALRVVLVFDTLVFATIICFGPGFLRKTYRQILNDELIHALWARALRLGYLSLVALLAATYLAIIHRPGLAPTILPWVLALGIAIPAFYFIVLEWRASRDGG